MVGAADENSRWGLLLEVAPQTKIGISRHQHFFVHRPVRIVTNRAAFAHRFMFKDKRPALSGMALTAGVMLGKQRGATALNSRTLMGVMAIAATHLAAQHRMAVGQLELPSLVQMTLKASLRRSFGVQNRMMRATSLVVDASRAMARFAPDVLGILPLGLQPHVCCCLEVPNDFPMAFCTGL